MRGWWTLVAAGALIAAIAGVGVQLRFDLAALRGEPVVAVRAPETVQPDGEGRLRIDLSGEAEPGTLEVEVNGEDRSHAVRFGPQGAEVSLRSVEKGRNRIRVRVETRDGETHERRLEVEGVRGRQASLDAELRRTVQGIQAIQRSRRRRAHPPRELVELVNQGAELVRNLEEAAAEGLRSDGERERVRDAARAMRDRASEARAYYARQQHRLPPAGAERRAERLERLQETVSSAGERAAAALESAAEAGSVGALRAARERLEALTESPHPPPSSTPTPSVVPTGPPEVHPLRTHVHEAAQSDQDWYEGQGGEEPLALLEEPLPEHFRPEGLAQVELGPPAARAQSSDPDLQPATGVRFDASDPQDPIVRKAAELGHDPIAIYEFVRNEIEFELYGGLARGATATLQGGAGNNPDQIALLVALLRASGFPARFVVGDIAAERSAVKRWLQLPSANGVRDHMAWYAPRPVVDGGDFLLYEHWWAKVLVPYGPEQGRDPDAPARWLFLDPSFKQHDTDLQPEVDLPLAGSGTEDETVDFSFQGGSGLLGTITPRSPVELYADQKRATLQEVAPGKTLDAVSIRGPIVEKELGLLPSSLPYRPLAYHLEFADIEELPDVSLEQGGDILRKDLLRPRLFITLVSNGDFIDENGNTVDCSVFDVECVAVDRDFVLADIATQRISVGWEPADSTSANTLQNDCQGDLALCDPGTVNLRAVLYRDGTPVTAVPGVADSDLPTFNVGGAPLSVLLGASSIVEQGQVNLGSTGPYCFQEDADDHSLCYQKPLVSLQPGARWLAATDFGQGSEAAVDRSTARLVEAYDGLAADGDRLQSCSPDTNECDAVALQEPDREAVISGLLHVGALRYSERVQKGQRRLRALEQVRSVGNGRGQAQARLQVKYLDNTPVSVVPGSLLIDIVYNSSPFDVDDVVPSTDHEEVVHRLSILDVSAKEHQLWEELTQIESISTVKGLQFANDPDGATGLSVLELLPGDTAPSGTNQTEIQPLLNQGFTVYTPDSGFSFNEWSGTVYYAERFQSGGRTTIAAISKSGAGTANGGWTSQPDPIDVFDQVEDVSLIGNDLDAIRVGDPVNVISGNLDYSETDLELPTVGSQPVELTRTYNSQLQESGPFGFGWTHSYRLMLEAIDDNANGTPDEPADDDGTIDAVAFVDGNGGRRRFQVASGTVGTDASFTGEAGEHGVLAREAPGLVVKTRNGTRFEFPTFASGASVGARVRTTAIVDPDGNTTSLGYTEGRVSTVTDPLGRVLELNEVTGDDKIDEVVDWTGRTWTYSYSGEDLVEVRNPLDAAAGRATSTYEYYSSQFAPKNDHNLRRRENALGEGMTYFYYLNDKVYKTVDDEGAETRYVYDAFRRESRQIDPLGRETLFQYDEQGQLARIVRPDGSVEDFAHDADRNVVSEIDALGGETMRSYDSFGNVKTETTPEGHTTEFVYWYEENTGSEPGSPRHNRVVQRTDPNGNVFHFDYNAGGHRTLESVEMDPDGDGTFTEIELRKHAYDAVGNRTKTVENIDPVTPTIDESIDRVVTVTYGPRDFHRERRTDGEGGVTRFVWDTELGEPDRGLLRRIEEPRVASYPDGRRRETTVVEERGYDLLGRQTLVRGPLGTERETVYDLAGRVKRRIVRGEDGTGTVVSRETLLERDTRGRVTRITDPLGNATRRSYDLAGNLTKEVDRTGRATRFRYDDRDRRVARTEPGGGTTRIERDGLGRVVERTDATGRKVRFEYDADGFRTARIQCAPVGACDPAQSVRTEFERDPNGNRIGVKSPRLLAGEIAGNENGHSTSFVYDELGRRVAVRDAKDNVRSFELDLRGNRRGINDRRGNDVLTQEFDREGRLLRRIHGEGREARFAYDSAGNPIAAWDGEDRVTTMHYDLEGREARVRYPDGREVLFGFDGFGNRVVARSPEVTYTTEYDALGRPVRRTDSRFSSALRFTWDAEGRLRSRTGLEGGVTQRRYGPAGRLIAVRGPEGTEAERHFDRAGRLVAEHFTQGFTARYRYDALGRIDRIESGSGSVFRDYLYDPNGNTKEVASGAGTEVYTYDALDRLTHVDYPDGTSQGFDYDPVGNRIFEDDRGTVEYHKYDAANRRTKTSDDPSFDFALRTYTYDAATGALEEVRSGGFGDALRSHEYDGSGRLVGVTDDAGESWSYRYDALGRRISQTGPTRSRAYVWAGEQRLADYAGSDGSGGLAARYTHGAGPDDRLWAERFPADGGGATVCAMLQDALGSVVASGAEERHYGAYGGVRTTSGSGGDCAGPAFGYTGRPQDTNGLVYLRARYYDPALGRFLSPDPAGPAGGVNLYRYAASNPATFTDRRGLAPTVGFSRLDTGTGGPSTAELLEDSLLAVGSKQRANRMLGSQGSRSIDEQITGGLQFAKQVVGEVNPSASCIDCPGSVFAPPTPAANDDGRIGPTEAIGIRGMQLIDDPEGLPVSFDQVRQANSACAENLGCASLSAASLGLGLAPFVVPAVEAAGTRAVVSLGPAAPAAVRFGSDFAVGFAQAGPPPNSLGGAAGFAAGRAASFVSDRFALGE